MDMGLHEKLAYYGIKDEIIPSVVELFQQELAKAKIDELEDLKRDDVSGPIDTALWIYLEARIAELKAQQEEK